MIPAMSTSTRISRQPYEKHEGRLLQLAQIPASVPRFYVRYSFVPLSPTQYTGQAGPPLDALPGINSEPNPQKVGFSTPLRSGTLLILHRRKYLRIYVHLYFIDYGNHDSPTAPPGLLPPRGYAR